MTPQKDFSSISPSAKSLLMMKAYTDIPYARETAALTEGKEVFDLSFDAADFWFWIRVMHFELRYRSIDQLLQQASARNVLELSSGFSFRGLALADRADGIRYIDTDLPEIIGMKEDMLRHLQAGKPLQGQLELLPLNALDEAAFEAVVARFDAGPISIINEGLLMYLNTEEKTRLCRIIHAVLKHRGGCWITADIYVKRSAEMRAELPMSGSERDFHEQHQIEANKFDSYDAARAFFEAQGFGIVAEAEPDYGSLSVMPHLMNVLPEHVRNSPEPPPKIQATWMLRAV